MSQHSIEEMGVTSRALSVIDRVSQFQTALQIATLLLALDIAVSMNFKETLLSVSWESATENITIGHAFIFIIAYSFYMSLGVIILRSVADKCILIPVMQLWEKLYPREHDSRPPYFGAVRPYALLETAHLEQNKFLLDLYNEYSKNWKKDKNEEWRISSIAFACLCLVGTNYLLLPSLGHPSITHLLDINYPNIAGLILGSISVILLVIWAYSLRDDLGSNWIYCLSVFNTQEIEKRQKLQAR